MPDSANLYIEPDGVRAAGTRLSGATSTAAPTPAVAPCAVDTTSVRIAHALSSSISDLINATAAVHHKAASAATRLAGSAETYEAQESANAAALANGSGGRGTATPSTALAPDAGAPLVVAAPPPMPGVQPSSGKEIAALMHGGTGPAPLDSAALALKAHAGQLDSAAQSVRSARLTSEQSWESAAAQRASAHLAVLESAYSRHADHARALSRDADAQASNFRQARSTIPRPEYFADLERRLQAASAANAAPGSQGRYTALITKLQTELAAAHQQAITSYTSYTTGGELQSGPLDPGLATTTTTTPAGAGAASAAEGQRADETATDGDALAEAGEANGLDSAAELAEAPLPGEAGELMQTVLPAVLGAVTGAAGGLLGALSGAAQQVQQTGTQLVSGLAQGGASALQGMAAEMDSPDLDTSGLGGSGEDYSFPGGGGSPGGGTEPASAPPGPLASGPAAAAAAPASAPAPTFGSSSGPGAAGVTGVGAPMGGAMMPPPMMGGAGRGGGPAGEDERQLYEQRRLRLENVDNAEPVKGRREARESRSERRD